MNNMYDILDKMNLLEGRGAKPDFLDLDKDKKRKETMKSAAADADEPKKPFSKMAEADMEEGNKYVHNVLKAKAAGLKKADLDGDGNMEPVREENLDELDMKLLKGLQGAMSKNQKDAESERNIHKKYGYRSDRDDTGNDDDYDEHGNLKAKKKGKVATDGPKKKGRPAGTGRKLGAKGPTGRSKLMRMKEDETQLVDRGEYDREGDMAKEQLHTIEAAAKELHDLLSDDQNLPEWVQSKITKAMDYIDTARDYMMSQEHDQEAMPVAEKAVSRQQQKFMGMAHAMQKGKKIKGASPELKKVAKTMSKGDVEDFAKTKHKGLPEKKKKEEAVDETTVAGSVATAPASAGGKGKKGMVFGKGVYESQIAESFEKKLSILSEGMSINMSMGPQGEKSLTVTASDEDAVKLAQILKLAGLGSSGGYEETCSACGQSPCGCEQMEEDYSNSPEPKTQSTEYMTNTNADGLNKKKVTGMTTIPVVPTQQVSESEVENHLMKLYQQYKTV